MKTENRLFYSDNLRIMVTILVIAYNVGQAFFRPAGASLIVTAGLRTMLLGPFFAANRSFFMSLFFLISGYFMVGSYERSGGARAFLSGRLVRLALPVIAYGAVMIPLKLASGGGLTSWTEVLGIDNLWYVRHAFFRVALADLPRDIGFFIIGAIAYPRGGLGSFPRAGGFAWLAVGALSAAVRYVLSFLERSAIPSDGEIVRVFSPAREAVLAGAVGVSLLVLFRRIMDLTMRPARREQACPDLSHLDLAYLDPLPWQSHIRSQS